MLGEGMSSFSLTFLLHFKINHVDWGWNAVGGGSPYCTRFLDKNIPNYVVCVCLATCKWHDTFSPVFSWLCWNKDTLFGGGWNLSKYFHRDRSRFNCFKWWDEPRLVPAENCDLFTRRHGNSPVFIVCSLLDRFWPLPRRKQTGSRLNWHIGMHWEQQYSCRIAQICWRSWTKSAF